MLPITLQSSNGSTFIQVQLKSDTVPKSTNHKDTHRSSSQPTLSNPPFIIPISIQQTISPLLRKNASTGTTPSVNVSLDHLSRSAILWREKWKLYCARRYFRITPLTLESDSPNCLSSRGGLLDARARGSDGREMNFNAAAEKTHWDKSPRHSTLRVSRTDYSLIAKSALKRFLRNFFGWILL